MKYQGLINDRPVGARKKTSLTQQRGCSGCPLNTPNVVKVKGISRIAGRRIFVWGQAPGRREVEYVDKKTGVQGLELIGPSGTFFWREAAKVGIRREDCDINNVVRCRPTEYVDGVLKDRVPSREEIQHCSVYNERAFDKNQGKAKVHIVLGIAAARVLFGSEFRKDRPVFWSDLLNAQVFCIPHPSYFLRSHDVARSKLRQFRSGLRAAAVAVGFVEPDRFAFINSQDFKSITDPRTFAAYATHLKEASRSTRIALDIENTPKEMLCIGFSWEPGVSRTIYLDDPSMLETLSAILVDPKVRVIAHHGVYDVSMLAHFTGIVVASFDYDTEYAEYLADTNRRSYSLAEIAGVRFPEYAGYKEIVAPYVKDGDWGQIPRHVMTPYNGADCSLSKAIEKTTRTRISLDLLHLYMEAAFIVNEMQGRGPKLDYSYFPRVEQMVPMRMAQLREHLAVIAGNRSFNPRSVPQIKKLLYEKLNLPVIRSKKTGKVMTDKDALATLGREHAAPGYITEYRQYGVMNSTYLQGYKRSADQHEGELRTKWWLTGTTTGRLRGGGGGKKTDGGIVNFMNLHGNPMLLNLLVSDTRWRDLIQDLDL
jgi:uracil-DNA glycosylase family 4